MVPLTHNAAEDGATERRTLSRVGRLCPAGHTQAMCAHTRARTHRHTYGMRAHVCKHANTHTCAVCRHIHMDAQAQTHMHTHAMHMYTRMPRACTDMCTHRTHMLVHTRAICTPAHVHTHAVCTHAYTCTQCCACTHSTHSTRTHTAVVFLSISRGSNEPVRNVKSYVITSDSSWQPRRALEGTRSPRPERESAQKHGAHLSSN